ncbi:MAG: hypothetical protein A2W99_14855 [Bacteroidetes bacterium GWF2_33_16]|nr:MAG: hypothetical protein A2X00_07970 [Bacteroidetes bacterium GWE2_32_14]OFY04540.1 MAG: hypothetical protein A2W99_14855 [Bacteroidetes bacterium GWF2_33_16]
MKPITNSERTLKVMESNTSDNARSTFLSHVSHGIRTPLNSIMGFSKLLMDRQMIDGKPKEYAQRIVQSSNMLLNFVDNLIDLSHFESNKYISKKQSINLNDMVWEIVEGFISKRNGYDFSEIELAVLWESDAKDIFITTDCELLKKSVNRLINLVANIYIKGRLELGYKYTSKNQVRIFIRPLEGTYSVKQDDAMLSEDEPNTFDKFNFEVLEQSAYILGGRVCTNSIMNEYFIELPV